MSKHDDTRLGKGLAAIFGDDIEGVLDNIQQGNVEGQDHHKVEISVHEIKPNPYQPRKDFDDDKIEELASSIRLHGVFTPILVKKSIQGYELVAGERRWRASKIAGLEKIPAILVDFDDTQMMEIALLENIQRENLNAIEEAQAFEKMIMKLSYTQEDLAKRVGKSREHIANMLRLLKLPKRVQNYVVEKQLSMGHVRALLALQNEHDMVMVAQKAIAEKLSVRAVEALVKQMNDPKPVAIKKEVSPLYKPVQEKLQEKLQTKVKVDEKQITIQFHGDDDLNRILEILHCLEEE
ncbi:MAG: ParB/RepB/Spo0J family partition protein [Erysipelotrichaceae bacterium]|nr:ParB/RepB/Spo0J family partition protein [Erysipelotrichaceae bacterium]